MLNRLTLKQRLIISLCFTGVTILLFSIGVFGLLQTQFDWHVLLNYIFVGLGIGVYVFILTSLKLTIGFLIFVVGYIIAYVSMFYMFAHAADGFTDLAGILLWMITIGLVIALGIAVEVILHGRRKSRIVDVEAIEHEE